MRARLPWIDHLRTLVIVLVVNMHACVTYSHVGGWYVMADHLPTEGEKILFVLWQAHLQSFFMGLLFFVAGYFAQGALDRRGPGGFWRERLWRLGLPTLLYMLVIHPFILLGLNPWKADFPPLTVYYPHYLASGRFLSSSGPMWFAFALLIFSSVLALWTGTRSFAQRPPPGGVRLALFGVGLGLASFLVRIVQPFGASILNFQLCFFSQYIAVFIAGLAAARQGWLVPLAASQTARRAGWLALIGGPVLLFTLFLTFRNVPGSEQKYSGGWNLPALGLALWEQPTGVGLGLGLMSFCFHWLNRETPFLRWLADRSFGVYLFHPPVLIALTMAYRSLPPNPFFLATLLTVTTLIATFALSDLARRIPGLRSVL